MHFVQAQSQVAAFNLPIQSHGLSSCPSSAPSASSLICTRSLNTHQSPNDGLIQQLRNDLKHPGKFGLTARKASSIACCRYLAGDSLEHLGVALVNAGSLARKTVLAYIEELQLQGKPNIV